MFTDMLEYTRLAHKDEAVAVNLLEEHRRLLRHLFPKYHGREIKTIGDAFLVEFASAVEAVKCGLEIQQDLYDRNSSSSPEAKILIRIGVHVGEVIVQDGDVIGDAVNIASRIEPLAEPGGICVSEQVFDHIQNKVEVTAKSLGALNLKNVSTPIEIYQITASWSKTVPEETSSHIGQRLAVLPLVNISANKEDEYFADGLTEELISTVSKVRGLSVISRTSVMRYKGRDKSVAEIGKELRVGTVLEGSVRRAGNKVRIAAQLINVQSDRPLWSQSYDRNLDDIFSIQSDVSQRVAEALKIELLSSERIDIERKATANIQAHTLYLKGRYYWNERTREAMDKAVRYFEEAVKLDPLYAIAYVGLADCYIIYGDYGWLEPKKAFPQAKDYALRSVEIDSRLAEPHASLGTIYTSYEWMWQEAEKEFKQAIELNPSYATAYQWYGLYLEFMGRLDESYAQTKRASELDPLSRIIGANLGAALMIKGKYTEAIDQLDSVIEANPNYANAHDILGLACYLDSRTDDAVKELRKAEEMSGGDVNVKSDLALVLGFSGSRDEACKILDEIKELSKTNYVSKLIIAWVLFAVGRSDEGFSYLDVACEERSATADHGHPLAFMRLLPLFSDTRKDPRWAAFERRLGLREV